MLKTLLLYFTTLALVATTTAQNLVLNPSFEDTVDCSVPTQCTLLKAAHWYNPTTSTPDIWDCNLQRVCGYAMDTVIPMHGGLSAADGYRYAGLYLWDGPNSISREYIMTPVVPPLMAGENYEVSLVYSRSDCIYAIDHIGVWFGSDSIHTDDYSRIDVEPQLELRGQFEPYLRDSITWTRLVDTVHATNGAAWMIIGNFQPIDDVNGLDLGNGTVLVGGAYYFIDDVTVRRITYTSISERHPSITMLGDQIVVEGFNPSADILVHVFDGSGRLVFQRSVPFEGGLLTVPELSTGFYTVLVRQEETFAYTRLLR